MNRRSFLAALFAAPIMPVAAAAKAEVQSQITIDVPENSDISKLRMSIHKADMQRMVQQAVSDGIKRRTISVG